MTNFTRPKIMGILNVTPDSFSDGGQYVDIESAVKRALEMLEQGANIIDIGGESTRPGAAEISVKDERLRTIPIIETLRMATRDFDSAPLISIDTRKPDVAYAAMHAGADIWNDVSALGFDARSPSVAADLDCPLILMHAQGTPETMQDNPQYADVVSEVVDGLKASIDRAIAAGVRREAITIDPGIGFGKRNEDNLALLRHLNRFKALDLPILMGTSRKSFIGNLTGASAGQRIGGSLASALWSAANGADILRVHDVAETEQALIIWEAIANG